MARPSRLPLVLALALSAALPARLAAQTGSSSSGEAEKKKPSADEEIEDLIGPTYADTMTVTGTRQEVSIINAPVSISVVDERAIATSAADNYADLLRGVPGLNIIQTSARDVNFKSRGSTNTLETGQLALVDGRSVYLDFFGFVAWDLLPVSLDEVKSIEVLRGPGSAVWGANALNGVVNVRTKSPRDIQGGYFSALGGEVGTLGGNLRWADAPSDTFSYKISASYFEQDPWPRSSTLPSGGPLPIGTEFVNRGTEQPKLDLRFDWERENGTWSLKTGWAGSSGIIHTGIGPFTIEDSTWLGYIEGSYDSSDWDLKVFANVLDGEAVNLLNGLQFLFDTKLYALQYNRRTAIGSKNLLLYGIDVRANSFDLSIAPRDDSRNEYGIYLEDQIIFNEHVRLNIGARFDHFDTIGSTISPRTSLIFKPTPDHAIRLAYNQAFRSPSLVNNYLETLIFNAAEIPGLGTIVFPSSAVGNATLTEETMEAFELGYTGQLSDRVTFTAAVYRNFTEDVIDFYAAEFYGPGDPPPVCDPATGMCGPWPADPNAVPPGVFPKTFTYRNIGKVRDQGVELGLNVDFTGHVSGTFSYAWQDEPSVSDPTMSPQSLVQNIPPKNTFSSGVNWDLPRVFGSANLSYTDEAFWSDVLDARYYGTTSDYWLLNASVGVRLADEKVELVFSGTNLLDEDAQQHAFGDIIGRKLTGEVRVRW